MLLSKTCIDQVFNLLVELFGLAKN